MDKADKVPTAESSLALGDSYFVDEEYEEALNAYAVSLTLLKDDDSSTKFRAYSHKVATHIKLKQYTQAIEVSEKGFSCLEGKETSGGLRSGETEVAYYRQGQILIELERFSEAKIALNKALQLAELNDHDGKKYKALITKCEEKEPSPLKDDEKLIVEEVEQKAPKTATVAKKKKVTMPKYQYYQNDKFMTIAILESNVTPDQMHVTFRTKHLTVIFTTEDGNHNFTVICDKVYDKVDVEKCKVLFKDEKVLVKLRKLEQGREWNELFYKTIQDDPDDKEDDGKIKIVSTEKNPNNKINDKSSQKSATGETSSRETNSKPVRPYASHKDWNAIDRDLAQKEKEEKPEGEAAMNSLFQQIYKNSDDDTRRAMIKSYQTSGGTVLSTDWNDVKKKDYEKNREAPNGMEWKTWEGDKV